MAKLPGNKQLTDAQGRPLFSLRDINLLDTAEKETIYISILPPRLFDVLSYSSESPCGTTGESNINFIAPRGLGILRIEAKLHRNDRDKVFFLELADTHYRQIELAFCIINDLQAPRFDVDMDSSGSDNCFTSFGRNIPAEIGAMKAGLFPNQTHRGLKMFSEFFALFERFVDRLGMEMIVAEPLTYDNAIRYEKYGFDYVTGKRLMLEINDGFKPDGVLFKRLDGSTPFRTPGMERTARGRSWAIHDGILDEPWDNVKIYKMVGESAGVITFPDRETEEETSLTL